MKKKNGVDVFDGTEFSCVQKSGDTLDGATVLIRKGNTSSV